MRENHVVETLELQLYGLERMHKSANKKREKKVVEKINVFIYNKIIKTAL